MQQKLSPQRAHATNSDRQNLLDDMSALRRSNPTLSDEELLHLKECLDWYFEFALRVYSRLHPPRGFTSSFDDGISAR